MENNVCVFCGQDLSAFNSKTVYCATTKQPACRNCYKQLLPLSAEDRARRALATSRARDREVLRTYLAEQEQRAQEKAAAEERARKEQISDKMCPRCALPMRKLGRKKLDKIRCSRYTAIGNCKNMLHCNILMPPFASA